MELIQTVTVGSGGAASITFSSIPATYDDLQVVFSLRNSGTSNVVTRLQFNADIASNYSSRLLYGTGSSAASFAETRDSFYIGNHPASSNTANTFGSQAIYIPNYRSTVAKSVSADTVEENNATASWQQISAHLWTGTAAITSIRIYPDSGNWVENSSASLYGIRKFNTSAQPKATGGAISFDAVNNKWVHVFSTSGTFTPTANITCEYLVVAGGGGGGGRSEYAGGGGGGGGFLNGTTSLTSSTNYTVTVGAGGSGSFDFKGSSGANSVFSTFTATGGGFGGGSTAPGTGGTGGSGGGGGPVSSVNYNGGSGTSGQGNSGGNSAVGGGQFAAGGGGGKFAAGGTPTTSSAGGSGGNGEAISITGTSVTYAGGGGGGRGRASGTWFNGGTAGTGGGGKGAGVDGDSTSGTANLGGGGGGGGTNDSTNYGGKNGGSGIVIVRYDA
jgi:hypothetical protein